MSASGATAGVAVGIVDAMTDVAVGISAPHYEVHEGASFKADLVDEALGDGDTVIFAFKTAAGTKRVHLIMRFSTLVGGGLELWEGATWTAQTGTETAIINRKRETSMDSSNVLANQAQAGFVAADVVNTNPTGLNTGAAISVHHLFAWGVKNQGSAGGAHDIEEVILKPDTQYAVVFTAIGASNKAHVILNWYEHTDA